MKWHSWKWRLGRLFGHKSSEQDLDEEIRAHLAIDIRQRIEAGDTPEAARIDSARPQR